MAQLFPKSANVFARTTSALAGAGVLFLIGLAYTIDASSYFTREEIARPQPVYFSHKHHVAGLGMDCRYCHVHVEESASAGIPPTHTCMTCHSQVWTEAPTLELVRESYREEKPLRWNRVHDLPDFAYFDHSIHISKGVGCVSCHGNVAEMPLVWKEASLRMGWCLDCHRNPEPNLVPRDRIFDPEYQPPSNPEAAQALQKRLASENAVAPNDDCYTCHR